MYLHTSESVSSHTSSREHTPKVFSHIIIIINITQMGLKSDDGTPCKLKWNRQTRKQKKTHKPESLAAYSHTYNNDNLSPLWWIAFGICRHLFRISEHFANEDEKNSNSCKANLSRNIVVRFVSRESSHTTQTFRLFRIYANEYCSVHTARKTLDSTIVSIYQKVYPWIIVASLPKIGRFKKNEKGIVFADCRLNGNDTHRKNFVQLGPLLNGSC